MIFDRSRETYLRFGERKCSSETAASRCGTGQSDLEGGHIGKFLNPAKRSKAVDHSRDALRRDLVSERQACRVLDQPRSTPRRKKHFPCDESRLVKRMIKMTSECGRYGYRRVTALLRAESWQVNHKRIERLWRREGIDSDHS